ncbi:hypothetical protein WJX73_004459, partial [Symbiochloris irregularis]
HPKRLVSVEANAKFSSLNAGPDEPWQGKPPHLKEVVAQLKANHELTYVYAWHALAAYWAGISTQAPSMAPYEPLMHWPKPSAGTLEVDPAMAWSSKGLGGGAAISQQHHASIEASARTHFPGNHFINCMCHSSEDLYRMEDTLIARCSDDFYPLDPASHTSHVGICAFNSIFMGALIQPDWDMFHSRHAAGLLHATARALSGGPVYVSDAPGAHDFDLLKRVVLADGRVLRAKLPARPTRDCLFSSPLRDGQTALKVWNVNAHGGCVLEAVVRPQDVETFARLPATQRFALYSQQQQRLEVCTLQEGLRLKLGPAQSDIVTIVPVAEHSGSPAVTPIGLTNMLNSGGAVVPKTSPWVDLPADVVLDVFARLGNFADRVRMERACAAWRHILTDSQRPGLWGELKLDLSLSKLLAQKAAGLLAEPLAKPKPSRADSVAWLKAWLKAALNWVTKHWSCIAALHISYTAEAFPTWASSLLTLDKNWGAKLVELLARTSSDWVQKPGRMPLYLHLHGSSHVLRALCASQVQRSLGRVATGLELRIPAQCDPGTLSVALRNMASLQWLHLTGVSDSQLRALATCLRSLTCLSELRIWSSSGPLCQGPHLDFHLTDSMASLCRALPGLRDLTVRKVADYETDYRSIQWWSLMDQDNWLQLYDAMDHGIMQLTRLRSNFSMDDYRLARASALI